MNNNQHSSDHQLEPRDNTGDDEAEIEHLLAEVGARAEPPPELMQIVRAAVHAEWQATVAQRSHRKRMMSWSIAASVVTVALGALLFFRYPAAPLGESVTMASIVKIQAANTEDARAAGNVQISANDGTTWRDAVAGEVLVAGMVVRTDSTTRVALDFGKGLSVRMDSGSHFTLLAANQVRLERGRIYIDASRSISEPSSAPLNVQTSFGVLAHLGTQYQVQLARDRMVVSVREGRVAVTGKHGNAQIGVDERVTYGEQGEIAREAISPRDSNWHWATQVAPSFDIDNRSLASFLDWIARETGRAVTYATPEVRMQAERLILRGSVGNLSPDQALRAVLATTKFVHADSETAIRISL